MATASMQNRNPRQQQGQQQQQGPAKFKSTSTNVPPPHHRDSSNDRQENRYQSLKRFYLLFRPTWGRKNSGTAAASATSFVNRATTPSSPANVTTNAWTVKADERAVSQAHDQFAHLLFALTVIPRCEEANVSEPISFVAYAQRGVLYWHSHRFRSSTRTRISTISCPSSSPPRTSTCG